MQQRKALGKGLGVLIPDTSILSKAESSSIAELDIARITPNRYQPRKVFDDTALSELSESIKVNGVIQPITVRKSSDGGYELIAGERRWRAAQMAGFIRIPAVIKDASDREAMEIALIENVQREDLNPIETAVAYQRLIKEFNITQEDVAHRVGKERSTITNFLRLLNLPKDVRDEISKGTISMGHAKTLLGLPSADDQTRAKGIIIDKGLSVRETEALIAKWRTHQPAKKKHKKRDEILAVEESLRKTLGTKIHITEAKRGGKIQIDYYSKEDLQRIVEILLK